MVCKQQLPSMIPESYADNFFTILYTMCDSEEAVSQNAIEQQRTSETQLLHVLRVCYYYLRKEFAPRYTRNHHSRRLIRLLNCHWYIIIISPLARTHTIHWLFGDRTLCKFPSFVQVALPKLRSPE